MYGTCFTIELHYTSSFTRFAHSATSPLFAYVSNLALDSALCRAAAPRLCPLQLLLPDSIRSTSNAAPRLHLLQLLLADCIHFSCCSPIVSTSTAPRLHPLQLLLPDCVHFNCSPIASASNAAPRLHPLQLLLPDCVHFNCSPIASASNADPRLHLLVAPAVLKDSSPCRIFFMEFEVQYKGHTSLV